MVLYGLTCRHGVQDFVQVQGEDGETWYGQLQLTFRATIGHRKDVDLCYIKWLGSEVSCPYPWLADTHAAHIWETGMMGLRRDKHLAKKDVLCTVIESSMIQQQVSVIGSGNGDIWLRRK